MGSGFRGIDTAALPIALLKLSRRAFDEPPKDHYVYLGKPTNIEAGLPHLVTAELRKQRFLPGGDKTW